MTYEELTGNRAMNDYTANKVSYNNDGKGDNQQFYDYADELPGVARSAIHPAQKAPGESIDPIQNAEYIKKPNYAVDQPESLD